MHLVEQVGSGVGRIKNLMKEAGLPEPVFQKEGIFTVILNRSPKSSENTSGENLGETTPKTTLKTTPKTEDRILEVLKINPQASRSGIG